ncbi:MAG: zinc-dependent peptidase [Flavobacteriaceae bacterium]|nr:zinc-dependent peptidase [Flavobacteriaceae bacterium]
MINIFLFQQSNSVGNTIIAIFLIALILLILYFSFRMIEMAYVIRNKKPLYNHIYLRLRQLKPKQQNVLKTQFSFYTKLKKKQQKQFEHRVAGFIEDKVFIGRDGLEISNRIEVLVASTAVMLTFGFRDYYIGLVDKIFVYPDQFYSTINDAYHKGEFNPRIGALVISWKHFEEGYSIENDNLNLGIHEFTHAIHLNCMKERDVSSTIFRDSFMELTKLLYDNENLRQELIASKYFRDYAYTNQFEFLAVIIENFIETPLDFRAQFPMIYDKTKQMLNFGFAGY